MSAGPLVDQAPLTVTDSAVSEEDRQIEGLHKILHGLFEGIDDITTARAVASFMGCHMAHSNEWKAVIPGFMDQMVQYANIAIAAHKMADATPQLNLENVHGESSGET